MLQCRRGQRLRRRGQSLDTTPASVSRRVKALEQRLGVRLLQGTTRKFSLTEAGEHYFREGRLLHQFYDLELALSADSFWFAMYCSNYSKVTTGRTDLYSTCTQANLIIKKK